MKNRPLSVVVTLIFVLLNALIWLAFGLIVAFDLHPGLPDVALLKQITAALSLASSAVWLGLFFFLRKRSRIAWYLAMGCFALISILIIFDELGWIDLTVLAINLFPLVLLVRDRAWYRAPARPASGSN